MSKDRSKTSQIPKTSFRDLQMQIEEFRNKRDKLNKKTKEYINELQNIDIKIDESLKLAREEYKKKRDYWNNKVKKLKEKKIEYKNLFDISVEEKRKLQKTNDNVISTKKITSIKQIERKIDNLERKIETENLDIAEENSIIDKIKELAEEKQEFLAQKQNSEVFKLDRKIQIIKINLNKIYEQLNKWSNKSQNYHIKMVELYEQVNELKEKKKKMEEELIENKKLADEYHEQFLKVMNQRKSISKGKRPYRPSKRPKQTSKTISKRDEEIEKIKQDKLATALEKQKAGKKLNLFEARLILEKNE
ncbi:MAG: hypothetical protein ACFE85_12735 [Candidatus Hodarchaeota archaeon]